MTGTGLILRPLRLGDERQAGDAHRQLTADNFTFLGSGWDPAEPWPAYIARVGRERIDADRAAGRVPSTFLVAVVAGRIIGRASVRHELNDYLASVGGHIGYAVIPAARRRGYATEIARQSLIVARSIGIDDVLVTCDDANVGSATVIERCGGVLDGLVVDVDGRRIRRYWIGVNAAG